MILGFLLLQGEEEGPGDILDEELQKQLNEIADYDSGDEVQPASGAGQTHWIPCNTRLLATSQTL